MQRSAPRISAGRINSKLTKSGDNVIGFGTEHKVKIFNADNASARYICDTNYREAGIHRGSLGYNDCISASARFAVNADEVESTNVNVDWLSADLRDIQAVILAVFFEIKSDFDVHVHKIKFDVAHKDLKLNADVEITRTTC